MTNKIALPILALVLLTACTSDDEAKLVSGVHLDALDRKSVV